MTEKKTIYRGTIDKFGIANDGLETYYFIIGKDHFSAPVQFKKLLFKAFEKNWNVVVLVSAEVYKIPIGDTTRKGKDIRREKMMLVVESIHCEIAQRE